MDRIDRNILRILMEDGQTTNAKLAKTIGLSESATLERVRRLEQSGIIKGYTALVEPARVDRGLEVLMTFTLKNQGIEEVQRFIQAMSAMQEVLTCAQLLGRFDSIAPVGVREVGHLERFIREKFLSPGSVNQRESLPILKMVKRGPPPVPFDSE